MDGKLIKIITHKRTYRSILFISILCILSSYGIAQTPNYIHYTKADGLPSNHVYGCMQDSKGYIWFFTERGVSKFNGKTFKNFTTKDGLSRNDVWNMTEDSEGRLWLHTRNNEINYIRNDSVFTVPVEGEKVISIYSVSDWEGDVYFNEKFYHLGKNQDSIKFIHSYEDYHNFFYSKSISQKFRAGLNSDTILISGDNGIYYYYSMLNLELLDSLNLFKENEFWDVNERIEYFMGNIYTFNIDLKSLIIIDLNSQVINEIPFNNFFGKNIKRLRFVISNDKLIVQTELGIIIINEKLQISSKLIDPYFLKNDISRCLLDIDDNFWINTRNNGVYLLTNKVEHLYSDKFVSSNDQITDFHIRNNDLFIAIESGVIKKYSLHDLVLNNELELGTKVSGFLEYQDDFVIFNIGDAPLFISTEMNIRMDKFNSKSTKYRRRDIINSELIKSDIFLTGLNGGIFTESDSYFKSPANLGVYKKDINVFDYWNQKTISHIKSYNDKVYYSIKNKVFIFENYLEKEIFKFENDIIGIKNINENFIIVTSDGKVFSYENNDFSLIYDLGKECLDFCALEDDRICFLTFESLYLFDIATKVSRKIIDIEYFSGSEFNKIKANKNVIIAASNDGVHSIHYKAINLKENPPVLIFKNSHSELSSFTSGAELDYNDNNISINYDLINYNSLGKHMVYFDLYKNKNIIYKNKETQSGKIILNNLKGGKYDLEVKGVDTYGNESKSQCFTFSVKKPYWKTIWFYCFIFVLSWLLFHFITKQIIKRTEKRKDLELQSKLKLAELELAALQSQLNPHFIFNAMGSIQSLIQAKRVDEADEYLAQFSRLMRRFLISSKSKYIKLIHELEIIQDYIEIEKLRYNNFDFDIEIDPKIDVLSMLVPSLFIQPFVENAIAHGLFHKKGRGELKVFIEEQGEGVSIKIRDNGIGRVASKIINAKSVSNYKSYGMSLIKDRLATLNSIASVPYRFSIEDLTMGTQVNLWIPYNNKSAA